MTSTEPDSHGDEPKGVAAREELDAELVENDSVEPVDSDGQEALIGIRSEFSGPLPHPALLKGYDEVLPGSPERIFRMTEKQLDQLIECENQEISANRKLLEAEIAMATRAQWFTFVLVLAFLGLAACALYRGQTLTTVGAGLAALATIAYALRGRKAPSDDTNVSETRRDDR